MQYLVLGYDGNDAEAPARRHRAKEAHLALGHHMIKTGQVVFSTAILDDNDEIVGSMRVMQFDSQAELDDWLEHEPYVTEGVWKDIDIKPCRVGPSFQWATLESGGSREP